MRKIVSLVVIVCLTLTIFAVTDHKVAYADPISISSISAITLAVGSSLGIDWTMSGVTAGFIDDWMSSNIDRYNSGESLIQAFASDTIRVTAGKIAIGHTAYNAVCEFIDWIRTVYDLNNALIGADLEPLDYDDIASSLNGWAPYPGGELNGSPAWNHYYWEGWSKNGAYPQYATTSGDSNTFVGQSIEYHPNKATAKYYYSRTSTKSFDKTYDSMGITTQTQDFDYPDTYVLPTVLNPGKGWEGTIDPTGADTNLEDLVGDIFDNATDNTLDIVGEIVDVVDPPVPVDPDTPLSDVPWGEVEDPLNDIDTNIGDIADTFPDIVPAIESQTETLESIEEALEDEEIDWPKFDLRGLFPFCIPFDIYAMLQALDASPVAPHVQIPFVIQSIGFSYILDLNFAAFDSVAAVMRQMELIVYGIALAWATSKVIKW